jgi:hypothetical protein
MLKLVVGFTELGFCVSWVAQKQQACKVMMYPGCSLQTRRGKLALAAVFSRHKFVPSGLLCVQQLIDIHHSTPHYTAYTPPERCRVQPGVDYSFIKRSV